MPLTPADVHQVAFKKPPIGKRGYDEEDVDAFLDEVERELARLVEENDDLRAQMERGGSGDPDRRSAIMLAEARAQLEQAFREKSAVENTVRALQTELEQRHSQGGGAADLAGDSRQAGVLMMAQRTADGYLTDARREAEQYLAEARAEADDLTRKAQAEADAIESAAEDQHHQAVTNLNAERSALLKRLDDLARLEREYRAGLRTHLTKQLQDLGKVGE